MCAKTGYYLSALLILLVVAALAAAFGFIEPDSWAYLHMAQAVRHGQGCAMDGEYFAAFPCGYPLAIALTAPSADIANMVTSSKVTNFLLLATSFLLLAKEIRIPVATFVIFNPVTFHLYYWTLSENLFLFAYCGVYFAVARLARGETIYQHVALLGVFLIVGCLSRYFFGPFAVIIFLTIWRTYGRKTAITTLPAFVVAGVFFISYQKFNAVMTGYGTGFERLPAPETLLFLTVSFIPAISKDVVAVGIAMLVFLAVSFRHVYFWRKGEPEAREQR